VAVGNIVRIAKNIPTFFNLRPTKKYPNRDFWFENIQSGNPGECSLRQKRRFGGFFLMTGGQLFLKGARQKLGGICLGANFSKA
jgi:hypothetical protein